MACLYAVTYGHKPSGARALGLPVLPGEELVIGKATVERPKKPITQIAPGFEGDAPLWAYILAEAQVTSWRKADPGLARDDIFINSDLWGAVGRRGLRLSAAWRRRTGRSS
jgi:hypothetical protein